MFAPGASAARVQVELSLLPKGVAALGCLLKAEGTDAAPPAPPSAAVPVQGSIKDG